MPLAGTVGSRRILSSPRKGSEFWQALDYDISDPGKYGGQIAAHGKRSLRQLSTAEKIAATL